jgi:hypothetical protein
MADAPRANCNAFAAAAFGLGFAPLLCRSEPFFTGASGVFPLTALWQLQGPQFIAFGRYRRYELTA